MEPSVKPQSDSLMKPQMGTTHEVLFGAKHKQNVIHVQSLKWEPSIRLRLEHQIKPQMGPTLEGPTARDVRDISIKYKNN